MYLQLCMIKFKLCIDYVIPYTAYYICYKTIKAIIDSENIYDRIKI